MLACTLLGGCAGDPDARVRALEERIAALEGRVAELEGATAERQSAPPAPRTGTLEDLETRLQALERAATGEPGPSDLVVDAESGRVTPRPTESLALDCAYRALGGVVTAELANDAAFDRWEEDFEKLHYTPDPRHGCDRMVASRVTVDGADFDAVAVVVAGPARGRWYHAGKDGKVIDGGRMPEADVLAIEVASKR